MKQLREPVWKWLVWGLVALSVVVFLKNAWVAEDAYILFRSIEQLAAGNGPIWNPHERVQVFTSPLWFWVLAGTRLLSADLFLTTILLSLCLWLVCLHALREVAGEAAAFLVTVSLLMSSSAFFDFTTSGLENILAYTLLAFILALLVRLQSTARGERPDRSTRVRPLCGLFILSGLILLVRHDLVFLVLPAAAFVAWSNRRVLSGRKWAFLLAAAGSPLFLWTGFSLIYYGFPVPNTAYAKLDTGVPKGELIRHGLIYLKSSAAFDSLTLIIILLAVLKLLSLRKSPLFRALAFGILLNLAYIVWVGGDFMQGRFLSYAFLVSAAALPRFLPRSTGSLPILGLIWIYALFFPHTPVNSPADYQYRICLEHWEEEPILDSVADERGYYFRHLSLLHYLQSARQGLLFPDHPWAEKARFQAVDPSRVLISRNIGLFGYYSPLEQILIDPAALSDPLLARLQVRGERRIGHFDREIPEGYIESLQSGRALIRDPGLNQYYRKIQLITQSSALLAPERLKAILGMNLGRYEYLKRDYESRLSAHHPPLFVP